MVVSSDTIYNRMELSVTMQVSPEHLEAVREEAGRLPAVEITEVDLQWVQVRLFQRLVFTDCIESGAG